jgi:hypothetical protein
VSGRLSMVAMVPVLITSVVLPVMVWFTAATVRQDKRRNAYWARRVVEPQYRPLTGSRIWMQVVVQNLVMVKREAVAAITRPTAVSSGVGAAAVLPPSPPPGPVDDRPQLPASLPPTDLDPWIYSANPVIGSVPSPRTPGEPR